MKAEACVGVVDMPVIYARIVKGIMLILCNRYGLNDSEAKEAVESSPFKRIFDADPEMTAHTSSEAWARDIYELWKKQ